LCFCKTVLKGQKFRVGKLHCDDNNTDSTLNLVRLIVGSPDAETTGDLMGVRNKLNFLGIKFQEKLVIQVLQIIPGISGIINAIFGALWCKVTVNAFYIEEETRLFIDVSDVCKALLVLAEVALKQCPRTRQCAPNRKVKKTRLISVS
jgi:hypothetical protein